MTMMNAKNVTRDNGSLLMEVMSNKNQMSTDVKTLLNENFIKNIAFYHIIHDLKESKNDLLASDGRLWRKFVSINSNNKNNLPGIHPIRDANIIDTKIYFQAVWDMGLSLAGKGIRHAISVKKTSVYATIADRFKSKYSELYHVLCKGLLRYITLLLIIFIQNKPYTHRNESKMFIS